MARRRKRRSSQGTAVAIIGFFAVITALSAGIAFVWQGSSDKSPTNQPPITIDPALLNGPVATLSDDINMPVNPPAPISLPMPSPDGEGVANPNRVKNSYFDDAAFVGDSLTTGIQLYDIMSNSDVFAETGLGLGSAATKECIKTDDGSKITIPESLRRSKPNKIYVMLGGNSTGDLSPALIDTYSSFLNQIKSDNKSAIIYVQSVLPINEAKYNEKYKSGLTNDKINTFNVATKEMCQKEGFVYLDVASAFRDESGAMPADFTPDGMHLYSPQYTKWIDYLKDNPFNS